MELEEDPRDGGDGEEEGEDGNCSENMQEAEDDDEYEYTYADDDGDGDGDGGEASTPAAFVSRRRGPSVVFTGLDTIGCINDMVLKRELTRIQLDIEKTKNWIVELTWTEGQRKLGVTLEHEGFTKAHLDLTFPAAYPGEPPKFHWIGPRFDDTVDFVLGADVFEPTRKENWNDTFTCTNLLMIVMELVKDKYPITDELVWDDYEQTLIKICKSRLPGIPKRVKEGMIYFGVRIEPKEKGSKRSSGVGYSTGGRDTHDFSAHDAKFQELLDAMKKLLEASTRDASSIRLQRLAHIKFGSWLLQFLEEELPIFKFEEVHELMRQAIDLLRTVDPQCEEMARINELWREREALLKGDGKVVASATDFVMSVEDEFERHHYKSEGAGVTPSIDVVKRIMLELENLKDQTEVMEDGRIYVVFSEASCLLWKVLMIPSSGTPYFGGGFEFHISLPANYPNSPPKCTFMTTGGGAVRFNPNLYANGKTCLSLLGTWSGEPWDPAHSNMSQLLISILAFIFQPEPLRNEPGLEGSPEKSVSFYNAYIRLETVETAMLGMLQKPPTEFADVIKRHFKRNWAKTIRPDLVAWGEKYNWDDADASVSSAGGHTSGQITRTQWYKQAVGAGKYQAFMSQLIGRMDDAVAAIKGVQVDVDDDVKMPAEK